MSFSFYLENTIFPRNSVRALYQLKNLFDAHPYQHERWYLEAAAVHPKLCIRMEWTDKRALTVRLLWVTALWTCCTHPGVIPSQPWQTRDSSLLAAATAANAELSQRVATWLTALRWNQYSSSSSRESLQTGRCRWRWAPAWCRPQPATRRASADASTESSRSERHTTQSTPTSISIKSSNSQMYKHFATLLE